MNFECGIVGLPNVGKSTLFNAIMGINKAEAANYPFCTIEPNSGMVTVPDQRLERLAKIAQSKEIIPNRINFVDIAGLVKGASKGEGLGNKFLAHIRQVDAIIYVLRCFEDDDILHVHNKVDPCNDFEVIRLELLLADLQSLEKQVANLEKNKKKNTEDNQKILEAAKNGIALINNQEKDLLKLFENHDARHVKMLGLLTTKPFLVVCNVDEKDIHQDNKFVQQVREFLSNQEIITISAKIEQDISLLEAQEKQLFLEEMRIEQSGLDKIIISAYHTLNLETFFTVGPQEVHAWTITKNTKIRNAAGVIHTDLEKGFISADVISYDDFIEFAGEAGCREAGKIRQEGRDYIMHDGDIIHVKFNV